MMMHGTTANAEVRAVIYDRFARQQISTKLLTAHQRHYTDPRFRNRLNGDALPALERVWLAREYAEQLGARPHRRGHFAAVTRAYQTLFADDRAYPAIRDFVKSRLRTLDELSGLDLAH